MTEPVVDVMADFLTSVGSVLTAGMTWVGTVADTVADNPVMLVPVVLGIACTAIGIFKSLIRL